MDRRCPRKLKKHPQKICSFGAFKVWQVTKGKNEKTPVEITTPGCEFFVNHRASCFCFFKYAYEYLNPQKPLSDLEIAYLNCMSLKDLKKTEKSAIKKVKESKLFIELKKMNKNF